MKILIKLLLVSVIISIPFCTGEEKGQISEINNLVNTSHLDSLYEEISINGIRMGIIHIYSDYPDYKWTGDDDEGIACVDDAARAAIFYLKNYELNKDSNSLKKSESLINFLLYMQSENGYFYNFIFEDHTINKTHKNSVAIPDWWSWRALWALSEYYKIMKTSNSELNEKIEKKLIKSVEAIKKTFSKKKIVKTFNGIKSPAWLPAETAGDQAGVLILALLNYYTVEKDTAIIKYLNNLCDGILVTQKGSSSEIPYCAFLSWRNVWHAYGNSQSYALLEASMILNRPDLQRAALNEINYFYDYLIKVHYLSSFELAKGDSSFRFLKVNSFPQIAYNFRPMIFACLKAFKLTGDSVYESKAMTISGWYFGDNTAGKKMYDNLTGRCFDGINGSAEINLNSGAESTIEALLSMQVLEQSGISESKVNKNQFNNN